MPILCRWQDRLIEQLFLRYFLSKFSWGIVENMPYCVCWFVVHRENSFGFFGIQILVTVAFNVLIFAIMFSCLHLVSLYHNIFFIGHRLMNVIKISDGGGSFLMCYNRLHRGGFLFSCVLAPWVSNTGNEVAIIAGSVAGFVVLLAVTGVVIGM